MFLVFLLGGVVACDFEKDSDLDPPSWLSKASYGDHGNGDDQEYNEVLDSTEGMQDAPLWLRVPPWIAG